MTTKKKTNRQVKKIGYDVWPGEITDDIAPWNIMAESPKRAAELMAKMELLANHRLPNSIAVLNGKITELYILDDASITFKKVQ